MAGPREDGYPAIGHRGLRRAVPVVRLFSSLWCFGPEEVRGVHRLAAVICYDGQEPVLRFLRKVAVPEIERG